MIRTLLVVWFSLFAAGCVTGGNAVRDLSEKEIEAFQALDKRFTQNARFMKRASADIGELGAEYAEKEYSLELALAKAKQLEVMQAPWALTRNEFAQTQRSVMLYHLYEVERAQQRVLEARVRERRAAAQEVLRGYNQLQALMKKAVKNLEIILKHLNQPKSAQVRLITKTFLNEVAAFKQQLQHSKNPRLQKLAEDISHYEGLAQQTKREADRAVDAILSLKGQES